MKRTLLLLIFGIGMVVTGWGQNTYTWIGGNSSWITPTNWSPERTTPGTNDILVFNSGTTVTVTGVPAETIGQLTVSALGTIVNIQSGAATNILTISGGVGTDLSVASGTELNNTGSNSLTITLAAGATGSISGNMTFINAAHSITASDANGITFISPSIFNQGTGCTGNVFGSGTINSVMFSSGTTFLQSAGSNPFQKTAPASVVVFQTGSLFKINATGVSLSFSGRNYANFGTL